MAGTLPQIVCARVLQGLCGAALVPMSQAVLLDINPPSRHARAMAVWMLGVIIGPILGPVLGGWLTENYSWRWVFYINLPVGIISFIGISTYMSETRTQKSRFDVFGFASLSLAIGALQLMLDRGQLMDWFNSPEICIEAAVSGLSFYLFVVHLLTGDKPAFVSTALFKDRNFAMGNICVFIVCVVMFSSLALLPSLLQVSMNYPVSLAGWDMAPRGLASMLVTVIVIRFLSKVDPRYVVGIGLTLTAVSLLMMCGFYLQMDDSLLIQATLVQGLGVGMVFLTLSAVTFATLAPQFRNEGTAIFSLMRNLGSSVGISAVETLLTRNTQIMHSRLAEQITPFGDVLHLRAAPALMSPQALSMLNAKITGQAAMIAYNDDFKFMLVLTLLALPLVLFLRHGKPAAPAEAVGIE
jgi:MFS transporter, DHA2 family, multidrug resistance protein